MIVGKANLYYTGRNTRLLNGSGVYKGYYLYSWNKGVHDLLFYRPAIYVNGDKMIWYKSETQ